MSVVETTITGERDPDGVALDAVLHALRAPGPPGRAPSCGTWACSAVVGDVRRRRARDGCEFETVLARRLAHRYLKVVADAAAARPVPRVWRLLLDPPAVPPSRLALAEIGTLLDYDLTLAVVGAATVLGRTPGDPERAAHGRIAAVLGTCVRELVRRGGDAAAEAAAARLDSPERRATGWRRAAHLWTLRGRPAAGEVERDALDRAVRVAAAGTLVGAVGVGDTG